ncbi:ADP-dependent NAD(P)H-hydrate dehydratase [Agromyces archimandritae]|uniref:ADP-dependent (S)-NAD(P)H-hydrate dehydratase n=1 Tax=Agromyces archimandritae TaxID=2781962 RepID=A0A975FP18_9MICO|nr:ADP/ATP-dependent (S)-NAD(P)H-hydrate dehydratase [Agromyces archimandritae]QTX05207.1 NAD(P)H-hydrate dehydratase [Agromyces archimandritae]
MTETWREWAAEDTAAWIRVPGAGDDKYARGVLGVITGSHDYPGAAVLGVEAANRAGIGMVRYTGPRALGALVLARRPETVLVTGRVQAWLLGSGMDAGKRNFLLQGELSHALASGQPVVLDAGALDLVGVHTGPTVITPHARELQRLLDAREIPASLEEIREAPGEWAVRAANELGTAVLLKGAVTHIADPTGARYTVTAPGHWLATAGTGDVLGGILGAFAAGHADALALEAGAITALAASAAFVHGQAAAVASLARGGGPVTALDVADAVPPVIGELAAM